jgi:hypothetical protein
VTQPLLYVAAPVVEPYRYGLFGAAQPIEGDDLHWQLGVEWEPLACYAANFYLAGLRCSTGVGDPAKALPAGEPTTKAHPFAVYAGMECGSVGYDHDGSYQQRARTILELAGQHAAEAALWTGAGGNSGPMNAATTPIVQAAASDLTTAIGVLEDWLADHYSGVGVIHAKRGVNAHARRHHQTVRDPANPEALTTGLGTRWVFGGGYDGTGPAAVAPAAGQTWIYATGQLTIRRAPVTDFTMAEALDRSINDVAVFAEQPYVIGFDCAIGAALVDLSL